MYVGLSDRHHLTMFASPHQTCSQAPLHTHPLAMDLKISSCLYLFPGEPMRIFSCADSTLFLTQNPKAGKSMSQMLREVVLEMRIGVIPCYMASLCVTKSDVIARMRCRPIGSVPLDARMTVCALTLERASGRKAGCVVNERALAEEWPFAARLWNSYSTCNTNIANFGSNIEDQDQRRKPSTCCFRIAARAF